MRTAHYDVQAHEPSLVRGFEGDMPAFMQPDLERAYGHRTKSPFETGLRAQAPVIVLINPEDIVHDDTVLMNSSAADVAMVFRPRLPNPRQQRRMRRIARRRR